MPSGEKTPSPCGYSPFQVGESIRAGNYIRQIMTITLLQQDTLWMDWKANLSKATQAIRRAPGSDLYLLPEMFTTAFLTVPPPQSAYIHDHALDWMRQQADEAHAAICGSMVAPMPHGKYANRMYFVCPDGTIHHYDKSHLYKYGGEGEWYVPGEQRVIVDYRGAKILLEICYDLQFPMWCRNNVDSTGNILYDVIVYSANYPTARHQAFETLPIARAIENQCYVAIANRIGSDQWGTYYGGSRIIHPYGDIIAQGTDNAECEVTGTIDLPALHRYRKKYPVLQDIIWNKFF